MKNTLLLASVLFFSSLLLHAENNNSTQKKIAQKASDRSKDANKSKKAKIMEAKIKEQMEREKKYAKEQKFYQGDEYDLKAHEVDPDTLPDVPTIEPDYDFDITDVYRDDI